MNILVKRRAFTATATIGDLFIDGKFECFTLEDAVRPFGEKVFGKTAIPSGEYEVVLDESPKFKRKMPHVLNVPNFEGIRIHWGNGAQDTFGCILVGNDVRRERLLDSRKAFNALYAKLEQSESHIILKVE